jgi:hypothetical protein
MGAKIKVPFKGVDLVFDPMEFTPQFCREFRQETGMSPREVISQGVGPSDDLDTRPLMALIYYRMHHSERSYESLVDGCTYANTQPPHWFDDTPPKPDTVESDTGPAMEPVNPVVADVAGEVLADPETQGDISPI